MHMHVLYGAAEPS